MNVPDTTSKLGISWSPASVSDAGELSDLFNAIAEADDTPERLSPESMEHELKTHFDPIDGRTRVGRDSTGAIVSYATAYLRPSDSDENRAYVNIYVAPAWRNRGIDDPLIDWAIAAASAALEETEASRRYVCAWMYTKQKEAASRFEARGFTAVRHWWEMERQLAAEVATTPTEGFSLVPWSDLHDGPARLVYNSAFADHWGSTPADEESWAKLAIASPNFRRDFSFVAIADDEVVGYSHCEEYPEDWEAAGQREAWIGGLGVVRDWRKRGIATALLARSMAAMKNGDIEAAKIGVDSDSPTGAQHLYSGLGFVTTITGVTWQLEVDPRN